MFKLHVSLASKGALKTESVANANMLNLLKGALRKKFPNTEFFLGPYFQKNSVFGHFSRSGRVLSLLKILKTNLIKRRFQHRC